MREIKRDIVGAFLISQDNCIFLGETGVYAGHLAVPGGGIEPGETEEEAIHREVLEETGFDIAGQAIEKCPDTHNGSGTKILRDTGETVRVNMHFVDFIVRLNKTSCEFQSSGFDDFTNAQWYPLSTIGERVLTPPTRKRLAKLGYIHD